MALELYKIPYLEGEAMHSLFFGLAVSALVSMNPSIQETDKTVKMVGDYTWSGKPGKTNVVFEKTQTGKWDVAFHFTFSGKKHVYRGTAAGSLDKGELKGTVQNEEKNRTFYFKGSCKKGKFTGTHTEEGYDDVGTLTLRKS